MTNASVVIIIMHLGDECSFVEIRQQQSEINALPTFFGLLISSTYLVSIASRHHQNMWVPVTAAAAQQLQQAVQRYWNSKKKRYLLLLGRRISSRN